MTTSPPLPPPREALPVIPRIVRRTLVDTDRALLRPLGRAAKAAQRSTLGGIAVMAFALATLGAVAGLGMRSLTEQVLAPANAASAPAAGAGPVEGVRGQASLAARGEELTILTSASAEPSPVTAPPRATTAAAAAASSAPLHPTRAARGDAKLAMSHPAARPLTPPHRSKHHATAALQARR